MLAAEALARVAISEQKEKHVQRRATSLIITADTEGLRL
jgi:hypothetical protein